MNQNTKNGLIIVFYALVSFVLLYFLQTSPDASYSAIIATKLLLFILIPVLWFYFNKISFDFLSLKKVDKRSWIISASIGVLMILIVQGAYYAFQDFIDLDSIADQLKTDVGITKDKFLYTSAYISFGNSFIEEFFFRGVLFLALLRFFPRMAFWISSLFFAIYHVSVFGDWFPWYLFVLGLVGLLVGGLFFNWLNQRSKTIYPGWVAHICADISIMLIGFKMFGIL